MAVLRRPLRICLISVHGLVRATDLELGRDADTGGQTRYVVELARALAAQADVGEVELLTRRVVDDDVDAIYGQAEEPLAPGARIVRVDAGPPGYRLKEALWECLDDLVDAAEIHLRAKDALPDVLHSHYADAGYVGTQLSRRLGIPLIHTGHSLGRIKRERLIASGLNDTALERTYRLAKRIAAEEDILTQASLVITSTQQEVSEQWGRYDNASRCPMHVIPPGTDIERFHPPTGAEYSGRVAKRLERFLREPNKPIILLIARPDPRKNLIRQVEAYANDSVLRKAANLVVIAGTRNDIDTLDEGPNEVLTDLLLAIDREDLYGRVAYPKDIAGEDVAELYRLTAASRGVHVNAALTEPFGLTLLEAAASGLPVVATQDGGPRDILERCRNGVLVDPLDTKSIARGIRTVLLDFEAWSRHSAAGLQGVRDHFTWDAHAGRTVELLRSDVLVPPTHADAGAPPIRRVLAC